MTSEKLVLVLLCKEMPPEQKGMGNGRVKRTVSSIQISPLGSSTSSSHRFGNTRSASGYQQRSPSPPASAYFPLIPGDSSHPRFQATPNAGAHFAYSTSLRRHHVDNAVLTTPVGFASAVNAEATNLWTRVVKFILGQTYDYHPVENGQETPVPQQRTEAKDTLSAKFAHYSVEVCPLDVSFHIYSRIERFVSPP